jgi:ATP-dependent protease ClpP protease subunit
MTKHSAILIHQLSSSTSGKLNEMKTEINNLGFFMNNVKYLYLNNTKLELDTLENLLTTDIWLDSITCKNMGLVDEII